MPLTGIGISEIFRSSGSLRIKSLKLLDFLLGSILARLARGRPETSLNIPVKTVLLIRPGGIGDAVFLLPFLRLLAQKRPDLAVDILCEKRNAQVFQSQSSICRTIYLYDDFRSFYTLFAIRYTLIIDTEQWHYLSALVAYWLKPEFSIGFASRPLRAKLFNKKISYEINAYEIANFKKLFADLDPECLLVQDIDSCFNVPEDLRHWAREQTLEKFVTLSIGASIPEKRFKPEQVLEIIRHFLAKNIPVVLIGGRDVQKMGERILKEIADTRVRDFTGKVSLIESIALIKTSCLFIGPDSGIAHLACAAGAKTITLFGPSDPGKWSWPSQNHFVLSPDLPCSPCALFSYTVPICPNTYPCIQQLNMDKLFSMIEKQLLP